jgi:hypothetical protein
MKLTPLIAAPCRCIGGVDETGGYVGKVKLEMVSGRNF